MDIFKMLPLFMVFIYTTHCLSRSNKGDSTKYVACPVGHELSFECPCVHEGFNFCKFKNLSDGKVIFRHGNMANDIHKYKNDYNIKAVTLLKCEAFDEGAFEWTCPNCSAKFILKVYEENIECFAGDDIKIDYFCPHEDYACRFIKWSRNKKHKVILRHGKVLNNYKFQIDKSNKTMTIKDCDKHDEGIYIFLHPDFNFTFFIHVIDHMDEVTDLRCHIGHEINFECFCCPEEFDFCRLENSFGQHIAKDGEIQLHHKFEWDKHKKNIILKNCKQIDEGIYVWTCRKSDVKKQFHLSVNGGHILKYSVPMLILVVVTSFYFLS